MMPHFPRWLHPVLQLVNPGLGDAVLYSRALSSLPCGQESIARERAVWHRNCLSTQCQDRSLYGCPFRHILGSYSSWLHSRWLTPKSAV